jgi:hypothetical protein
MATARHLNETIVNDKMYTDYKLLKGKVIFIFLDTVGFSPHKEGR